MNFAENLRRIRKENNLSQEEMAEILNASRQSISKYEQGKTYPEIEKIIFLSKEFNITIDSLLNDEEENEEEIKTEKLDSHTKHSRDQNIHIQSYDGETLDSYYKFHLSPVFKPTEKQPKYTLMGTYQQNFWGEHSNILAYYASKEEALKEIEEIQKALESAESIYELDYYRNIKSLGIDIELDD